MNTDSEATIGDVLKAVTSLTGEIREMRQDFEVRFNSLEGTTETLAIMTAKRFDRVEERLDTIETILKPRFARAF